MKKAHENYLKKKEKEGEKRI